MSSYLELHHLVFYMLKRVLSTGKPQSYVLLHLSVSHRSLNLIKLAMIFNPV